MTPGIHATPYKNVIKRDCLRLQNPRLAGGKDVVNIVRPQVFGRYFCSKTQASLIRKLASEQMGIAIALATT